MNDHLPNDPMMCLSVVNTRLRDCYPNLESLCEDMGVSKEELTKKLESIDYRYDIERNQFI